MSKDKDEPATVATVVTSDGHVCTLDHDRDSFKEVTDLMMKQYPKFAAGPTVTTNQGIMWYSALMRESEDVTVGAVVGAHGELVVSLHQRERVDETRGRPGSQIFILQTYAPGAWRAIIHESNPIPDEWKDKIDPHWRDSNPTRKSSE